ncbi:hypothetical protein [Phytopseudomonas daroniae]|uniref:hypothetical protein n=1 Tax=Phytopseudomonas daroniae TaxID=2487519 RepID=UPI0010383821|nr:hypothetical protein [Pseudomonas daroniae]
MVTVPHTGGQQLDGRQDSGSYTTPEHQLNPGNMYSESVYVPSPKHDPQSGWGTPMDLSDKVAQQVLDSSIQGGKQKYGFHEGKLYEFQPDNAGGWHSYPIPGNEAPSSVLKELRGSGVISNAEYNRLRKGK